MKSTPTIEIPIEEYEYLIKCSREVEELKERVAEMIGGK